MQLTYSSGSFSTSCNGCTLDGDTLDFRCTCMAGGGVGVDSSINLSTSNLPSTDLDFLRLGFYSTNMTLIDVGPTGFGVFLNDQGELTCRVQ